ncbi:MAG: hypothetical protein ACE5JR_11165 [Gemmatimonadota bacterium]
MRRFVMALAALTMLGASGGGSRPAAAAARQVDCTDYCAERAAAHCERIDSWKCTWYILGCLAGCNIANL